MKYERVNDGVDELAAAQSMAAWFADYLYGVIDEPGQMPALAVYRLQQQFGDGDPAQMIARVRDTLMAFDQTHQQNLALYFCGYPDDALEILASEGATMIDSL